MIAPATWLAKRPEDKILKVGSARELTGLQVLCLTRRSLRLSSAMVRRRSGKAKAAQHKPRGVDRKDSKMKRWNTASDIPMDEEDTCMLTPQLRVLAVVMTR